MGVDEVECWGVLLDGVFLDLCDFSVLAQYPSGYDLSCYLFSSRLIITRTVFHAPLVQAESEVDVHISGVTSYLQ